MRMRRTLLGPIAFALYVTSECVILLSSIVALVSMSMLLFMRVESCSTGILECCLVSGDLLTGSCELCGNFFV